jgi:DNA-binding CsgD family transcriptional regulator/PAS domain-containing protein
MLEQFSATVQRLYAAAGDPELWNDAFVAVEKLTDCAGVVVNLLGKDEMTKTATLTSPRVGNHFSAADVSEYERELLPICPRVRAGSVLRDAPYVCDYMLLSEAEMDTNPVYAWFERHGLRYFIGSSLGMTESFHVMWSLQRTSSQGHVQTNDIKLFALLKPHFSRALGLAEQLGSLRAFERFSSSVFEKLPQALFALDGRGTILFANAAADALLRAGDGICCAERRLRTQLPSEQHRLDNVIDEAANMDTRSDGWVRVSRSSGGPPYAAFISPLNSWEDNLIAAQAKVVVVVHDTGDHRSADPRMLVEVYQLTDAEARLAKALSGGHSIESAASLLGVQPATIRSQLKSVFRKTGVSRQQDLVRLLALLSTRSELPRAR